MAFSYHDDRWRERGFGPMGGALTCLPPTCRSWELDVGIAVTDGEIDCFAEDRDADEFIRLRLFRDPEEVVVGSGDQALRFEVGAFGTGCRNWTPALVVACSFHNGRTYRLSTPVPSGCISGEEIPDEAFMDLVRSARPAS